MARPISTEVRYESEKQYSASGELVLVRMVVPTADGEVLIASTDTDKSVFLDSKTYMGAPFEVTPPSDRDGEMPRAQLRIAIPARDIIQDLGDYDTPPTCFIAIYSLDDFVLVDGVYTPKGGITPDTIYDAPYLFIENLTADDLQVTADLRGYEFRVESYPRLRVTADLLPGAMLVDAL